MHRIFVSYRDESAHSAGRLGHLLGSHFGPEQVFLADSIDAGADSAGATAEALRRCAVCVVVVGPSWTADAGPAGRRLDEAEPVIRQVRTVLERGIRVLPVLADGARSTGPTTCRSRIRKLARLHAVRLDHLTFRSDAERVTGWIETAIRGEPSRPRRRERERQPVSSDRPVSPLRGRSGGSSSGGSSPTRDCRE